MKQRTFVIGRGYVDIASPEAIIKDWDRAFAAVRGERVAEKPRAKSKTPSADVSWDSAFARVQSPRTGSR
ncbi:hypothetical protein PWP93_26975 [Paraburkholderia sp. A1RI-2L]|uniref:hypothetical protein n=1 Tax=Paraburkholderia sp. A1RI-2L TaxID=3028367 RepID=UPI003B7DB37D